MPLRGKSRVFTTRESHARHGACRLLAVLGITLSLFSGVHGVTQEQTGLAVHGSGSMQRVASQAQRTRILRTEPVILHENEFDSMFNLGSSRQESIEEAKLEVAEAALAVQKQEALEAVVAAAQEVSHDRELEEKAEEHLKKAAQVLDEVTRESNAIPVALGVAQGGASLLEADQKSTKSTRPAACITCDCKFMDRHGVHADCDATSSLRQLIAKWLSPKATVIEFGAMYGAVTCAIAKQQHNSGKLVAVDPDHRLWATLESNRAYNKCNFTTVRGFLGERDMLAVEKDDALQYLPVNGKAPNPGESIIPHFTFHEAQSRYFKNFDAAVIDCDGCLTQLLSQNAELFPQLGMVLISEGSSGGDEKLKQFEKLGNFKEVEVVDHYHVLRRNCGPVANCLQPLSADLPDVISSGLVESS